MTTEMTVKSNGSALALLNAGLLERLQEAAQPVYGLENVTQKHLKIPLLKVCQGMTPQLSRNHEGHIPGLQVGDLFNELTCEKYGPEVLSVPYGFEDKYIKYKPSADGDLSGVEKFYQNVSEVPPSELEFGPNGEKPVTTWIIAMKAAILKEDETFDEVCIPFSSSGLGQARKWITIMGQGSNGPCRRVYKLTTFEKSDGAKHWYLIRPLPASPVTPEFVQAFMKRAEFLRGNSSVDFGSLDNEERQPGSDDDAPRY